MFKSIPMGPGKYVAELRTLTTQAKGLEARETAEAYNALVENGLDSETFVKCHDPKAAGFNKLIRRVLPEIRLPTLRQDVLKLALQVMANGISGSPAVAAAQVVWGALKQDAALRPDTPLDEKRNCMVRVINAEIYYSDDEVASSHSSLGGAALKRLIDLDRTPDRHKARVQIAENTLYTIAALEEWKIAGPRPGR